MRLFWAALILALAAPLFAGAIFTVGNHPQPVEENVLFTADQSAASITGVTNITGTIVDFWSVTDILTVSAKGQATVSAEDGLINDVSIGLFEGVTFLDLILNPSVDAKTSSGTTTVRALLNDGSSYLYTYPADLGTGQNYLTITTSAGERISSITIDSASGFETLKQVRISGIPGAEIPEPASMALIGAGLMMLPLARKMRRG